MTANNTHTIELYDQVLLASDGAGTIFNVYGADPSGSPNWGDTNAVWGEYRVLAFKVRFRPSNRYSKTTTTCVPGFGVLDRRNATALATLDAAIVHESSKELSLEDPWEMGGKMSGSEESQFRVVSAPVALMWIKLAFTGLTISTNYGLIVVSYLVQFRNIE